MTQTLDDAVSCPYCSSYAVQPVTPADEAGQCEYRCLDCNEYFVDEAPGERPEQEEDDEQL